MIIEIHLKTQSIPIVITRARNAYQKGDLYCVMYDAGNDVDVTVDKFPIQDVFRIREHM